MDRFSEDKVMQHNHALIRQGLEVLANGWGVNSGAPDGMIGSMGLIPLPDGLPFPATEEGCANIHKTLWEKHRIMISPSLASPNRIWVRVSAQIYNRLEDYEKLAKTINGMRQ
jgi:isopenicillin-N epimerase